jgi:putative aldouronate transport system substrate-binding protein
MKRIVCSFICVFLVTAVLLTGCGSSSEVSPQPSTSATPDVSPGNTAEEGFTFPLAEPVTFNITVKTPRLASSYAEMELMKRIEQETNVHIEWNNINEDQYDQKKALLLASKDLPDAFFMSGFTDQDMMNAAKVGTLIKLDELIEKNAPRLKAILEKRPNVKSYITLNDGIYSLPNINEMAFPNGDDPIGIGSVLQFYNINKAWLDKLGVKVPETVDELHDALLAIKNGDPNENGIPDEVPLTFINDFWCADISGILPAWGADDNPEHRQIENNKVYYTVVTPEYKNAMRELGQWYKEGLIDPEAFTYKTMADLYMAKGKDPDYTVGSFMWWEITEIVGKDREADYITLPPIKTRDGVQSYKRNQVEPCGKGAFCITKACQKPDLLMAWVDRFYNETLSAEVQYGPIGIMYEIKDGKMSMLPVPEGTTEGEFRHKVCPGGGAPSAILAETYDTLVNMDPRAVVRLNDIRNLFFPYFDDEYWKPVVFTEEELKVINECEQPLKDYVSQMRAEFITKGNVDEQWDSYLAQLENLGLSKLLEVWQNAYDRMYRK